eukprot:3418085-Amphidinium_carterae.1
MSCLEEGQRRLLEQNKEIMRLLKKRPLSPPQQLLRKAPSPKLVRVATPAAVPPPAGVPPPADAPRL